MRKCESEAGEGEWVSIEQGKITMIEKYVQVSELCAVRDGNERQQ